ncbi:DUF177 domain-containing protein [bacterium]|nr:DUF177 domain-containing protein [bacterium]
MSWKLPLNQVGSGSTFTLGAPAQPAHFKEVPLQLDQHPWLQDILNELSCSSEGKQANFSLTLDVEKQSQSYRVKGHLKMIPQLECVRSLTQFRSVIESETEALFFRAAEQTPGSEHELSESEMESYEHDGAGLLLSEFVTDLIYTSLPDFPLCQPGCKGLCSECGVNLNEARQCPNAGQETARGSCPNVDMFK